MAAGKNRKLEMLESLLNAYDLMMNKVSSEEFATSNLFGVWMQQVATALLITDMQFEYQSWEEVRKIKVTLHERPALEAYGAGMCALLLGILYNVEQEVNR